MLRVASVRELVADISHHDTQLKATRKRLLEALDASGTTLSAIRGCGPVVAALILGHTGDVTRFASTAHFASYNATVPFGASPGERKRHRINQRGNRQLNNAIHLAAHVQAIRPGQGRDYMQRRIAAGNSRTEAMRLLREHPVKVLRTEPAAPIRAKRPPP